MAGLTRRWLHARTSALLGVPALLTACGGAAGTAGGGATKTAVTPIRVWFHWGGATGEAAQKLVDDYNSTQGQQDKNAATIETIKDTEMLEKMTAATAGGDPPDVWHASASPKVASNAGLTASFPKDEEQYVRQNYVPGAVDRMTLAGKVWGYPTEFQAPAYFYRKAHYREVGLSAPPATAEDVYEYAVKLTRKTSGTYSRFGFGLNYDQPVMSTHLPSLIARFGGQMYTFSGDRPVKVDVASPPALEAVGWWKRLVEAGVTQVGEQPLLDSVRNGATTATEYEVWYTLINLKYAGFEDIYQDLGGAIVAPKRGVKPVVYAGGWALVATKGAKQPEERWKLMGWMMHKPKMPFSRFIVERVGAIPSPTDYPAAIPGWSEDMIKTYAVDTVKIVQAHPTTRVLGTAEITPAVMEKLPGIITGKIALQTGLQELNAKLNEIVQRNNPA
jgi:multiple sugar transport system substrate-binding protein